MAQTTTIATQKFVEFLTAAGGVGSAISELAAESGVQLAVIPAEHIMKQNVPVALAERALAVKYPVLYVYSDRVRNLLTEKFRTFSGTVRTIAEVRVSQDRIDGIEDQLRLYVDAVTQVLDANRGSWGQGAFFGGAYDVSIDPVTHGGRNFVQVAKVIFEVDLSS